MAKTQAGGFGVDRRALWKLGIELAVSFPPGNLAVINKEASNSNL
jgi:hypothetical protein